ncbi:gamma-glutamyl-gamma-aminobutyrate hydrolase family protein, partial [candidate division KSB1 bacterium]|nr:gamma-glutamyl-gamma-aminobutyrate hydrolase family protein [candidate division KSB1 bacterium]
MVSNSKKLETIRRRYRPVIAVTGPDKGGDIAWVFINIAVRMAGGKPVRITPSKTPKLKEIHGLIISGGSDVDPRLYGEREEEIIPDIKHEKKTIKGIARFFVSLLFFPILYLLRKLFSLKSVEILDTRRDKLEFKFIEYAVSKNLPILGICRGAQLINVFFGGSLYQDISSFYAESPQIRSILPKKKI